MADKINPPAVGAMKDILDRLWRVVQTSAALRVAQRAYMADRGNNELGAKVAVTGGENDVCLMSFQHFVSNYSEET